MAGVRLRKFTPGYRENFAVGEVDHVHSIKNPLPRCRGWQGLPWPRFGHSGCSDHQSGPLWKGVLTLGAFKWGKQDSGSLGPVCLGSLDARRGAPTATRGVPSYENPGHYLAKINTARLKGSLDAINRHGTFHPTYHYQNRQSQL